MAQRLVFSKENKTGGADITLFEQITTKQNFKAAYHKCLKGDGKYSTDAILFAKDETYNLEALRSSIIDNSYTFSGYNRFVVFEPKERIVDAPRFKDKIVQIAINNILKDNRNRAFIYDSYACIDNKGTHKCVDRIYKFIGKAKWEYGEKAQIIKMDIAKFFYTIDREVLKKILTSKIDCAKTLALLFKIINSADVLDSLGLPLGNTLSQICANIYMDKLDQYCKRYSGIKYYARYADDIIVITKDKSEAIKTLDEMNKFIEKTLNLKANIKKTKFFPINQGVNTVGFKIHATHKLLRNDSKKRIKQKAKKLRSLIAGGKITPRKAEQIFNSWLGHANTGSSKNFIDSLILRNDYLFLDSKGKIRVNVDKLNGGKHEHSRDNMPKLRQTT